MDLPQSLHGQLFLLSYDRDRRRFDGDNLWLFGFALRAAMLTDLYLTGYLRDSGGKPYRSKILPPDDPVLRTAFDQIDDSGRKDWATWIALDRKKASRVVRDQLEATGGLRVRRGVLGLFAKTRLGLYEEGMVGGLIDGVAETLRQAMDGLPSSPRPLAAGLLAVLGQMPTVLRHEETARHRETLRQMTFAASPPIQGLNQAIEIYHEGVRSRMNSPWRW